MSGISLPNIMELYQRALAAEQEVHAAEEVAKVGNLRGGNTGVWVDKETVVGGCPRLAHLRSIGVEVEKIPADRHVMFAAGHSNEDIWARYFAATWKGEGKTLLRESEVPTSWATSGGTKVTGRPDFVFAKDGKPILGLENKMCASVWTAKTVLFQGIPKIKHLAQAAHYSWQLGIPWKIVYSSYVDFVVPSWAERMFPKRGQPLSEYTVSNDKGGAKKVLPFHRVYDLRWVDGRLEFSPEGANAWQVTPVTADGIREYFEQVAVVADKKKLPPRVTTVEGNGEVSDFSDCDYCPLNETCTKHTNYDKWLTAVREHTKTLREGVVPK